MWFVETEQCIDERGFSSAVWTEEANRLSLKRGRKVAQDIALAESNGKVIELDQGRSTRSL